MEPSLKYVSFFLQKQIIIKIKFICFSLNLDGHSQKSCGQAWFILELDSTATGRWCKSNSWSLKIEKCYSSLFFLDSSILNSLVICFNDSAVTEENSCCVDKLTDKMQTYTLCKKRSIIPCRAPDGFPFIYTGQAHNSWAGSKKTQGTFKKPEKSQP